LELTLPDAPISRRSAPIEQVLEDRKGPLARRESPARLEPLEGPVQQGRLGLQGRPAPEG